MKQTERKEERESERKRERHRGLEDMHFTIRGRGNGGFGEMGQSEREKATPKKTRKIQIVWGRPGVLWIGLPK